MKDSPRPQLSLDLAGGAIDVITPDDVREVKPTRVQTRRMFTRMPIMPSPQFISTGGEGRFHQ